MKRHRRAILLPLVAVATMALASAAPAPPAQRPLLVVSVQADRDEKEAVQPGQILTYTVTSANRGSAAARQVTLTNPVPAGTEYVLDSATARDARLLLSADGGRTYARWPVRVRDARTGRERPAAAGEVTHLQWILQNPLPPGKAAAFAYQVRVK